jgi:hypothetical protein
MYKSIFMLAKLLAVNYDSCIALRPFYLSFKGVYPMRKLMLGAVLLAAMLPVTTVYAAASAQQIADVKKTYQDGKNSKGAKKSAEDAIASRATGVTVLEAMTALIEADGNNVAFAVAAAIKADPTNAGPITQFALSKAPATQSSAITRAALAAVTTPEARRVVAAAASESGVSISVINTQLRDVTSRNGSYEEFAVNNATNTSVINRVNPSTRNDDNTATGNTNVGNTNVGNTNTSATQVASGGGGVCDPKKASCS